MCRVPILKHKLTELVVKRRIVTVPEHSPTSQQDVIKLKEFLFQNGKVLILTGAGISTESGIPDYRSKDVGLYARSSHKPTTYQEFVKDSEIRKRYWARSYVAWPKFSSHEPNTSHFVVDSLIKNNIASHLITQNVDNLHRKAGCKRVIELHGSLFRVICMHCHRYSIDRHEFQRQLSKLNQDINISPSIIRPDGDVDLPQDVVQAFKVANCPSCGGFLKPDVVFFGDNVPRDRLYAVDAEINSSSSLLILGSSVTVYSALRIVLEMVKQKKPVAIINIGDTRADSYANLKINAKCGEVLSLMLPLIS